MASEHHHLFEIAAAGLDGSSPGPHYKISSDLDDTSWSPCIQGYTWRCVYCTDPAAGTASFTICRLPRSIVTSEDEPVNASFKLSLLDGDGRPVPSRTRATTFHNCPIPPTWQWECPGFVTSDDLQRPEYLISDGCCRFTVRCDIAVVVATAAKADVFVTVPPSDLHRHLGDLLASKHGADVTFRVVAAGGETTETFAAHRCVLAARSPVFRAQLFGEMAESKSAGTATVVPIEDMEAQVFGSLLAFIYTDSLPLPPETAGGGDTEQDGDDDDDEAVMVRYQHLLAAADRYGVERMKLVCQEKLCEHIRAESVAMMLVLADRHHCPGLKEACFRFLTSSANLEAFTTETDGFEVLNASCPAVLKELLAKLATILMC